MVKKITNRSILGQRGINLIEEHVLAMGFAWHPTNQSVEAGIDGHIEIRNPDTEQALNLVLAVQSKARTAFPSETADTVTYYCEDRDIEYWMNGNIPVILVLSRPDTRDAYWVNVKQHFLGQENRQSKKIIFDKSRDRFDSTVRSRLFEIARPVDSGLYLAPLPKPEQLLPNLLPVRLPTSHVCRAKCLIPDPGRLIAAFKTEKLWPDRDWVMHGGELTSFQPLDQPPWPAFCDQGSVRSDPIEVLANSEDTDDLRLFVQLLNRCLQVKAWKEGIRYHGDHDLYYFTATENLRTRRVKFKSLVQQSSRTVFEAYRHKETRQVRFCRHLAFRGHFRRFGDEWFLEVTPTYLFTRDGRLPDRFEEDRLKGIKRLDRHRAVLGQLLTWIDVLTSPGRTLFENAYPHLQFARPERLPIDVGIDDGDWLDKEEPEEAARLNAEEAPTGLLFIA